MDYRDDRKIEAGNPLRLRNVKTASLII